MSEQNVGLLVLLKTMRDPGYRERLKQNPVDVLADEGITLPSDVEVRVLEQTPSVCYIVLPPLEPAADARAEPPS